MRQEDRVTHVLVDELGEGLSQARVVERIAIADSLQSQPLLPFVSHEEGTQFFGVCVDADPM